MYKPIWFKAFGRLRYTTLVRRCDRFRALISDSREVAISVARDPAALAYAAVDFYPTCFPAVQVSRPGGGFIVSPQPVLAHDQTDMEQSLSTMSGELKVCTRPGQAHTCGLDRHVCKAELCIAWCHVLLSCDQQATAAGCRPCSAELLACSAGDAPQDGG